MDWREREAEAAATLRACREALAARGSTVIREARSAGIREARSAGIREARSAGIREARSAGAADLAAGMAAGMVADMVDWQHYPEGEIYDPASHAQYFYHRHPAPTGKRSAQPVEHGHFHLFLRGEGMQAGIAPLLLPELAVANAPALRQSAPLKLGRSDKVCHLVALAVDRRGEPLRLFTTNRWVTGETWYRADDVIRMLDRFRVAGDHPSALLNRWIGALVRLFQPDIATLLRDRDKAVLEQSWRWRGNVLEDPRLEITSSRDIDLDARLVEVEERANASAVAPGAGRARRLPRMAEGWGS